MFHDLSDSSAAPGSFGPFRVLHQIGVGVLGPVFRAQDSVREQLVAVKAFKLDAPPEQAEEIADALQSVAQAMPRHRGLIEYIAAGVERAAPYLVMAHSDVPSLDTKLKPGVPLDAEEALDLIATLADAIDAAHGRGIIHGTLHPRDIFVDDHGGCRMSGFGVAATLAAKGIRNVPIRRPYSPPERVVGGPIERSADLFALGAVVFELFSGRRVVGTGRDAAMRLVVAAPDVDVEHLRTALAAMLAENPAHRPSSATAFAQAVTQAVRPRGLNVATARKRVTPTDIPADLAGAAAAAAAGAAAAGGGVGGSRQDDLAEDHAEPQEGAPREALELFTRQGTLWEANRHASDEAPRWETVSVAPGEDPLAQFNPESETRANPGADAAATAGAANAASAESVRTERVEPAETVEVEEARAAEDADAADAADVADDGEEEVSSIADAARHVARAAAAEASTRARETQPAQSAQAVDTASSHTPRFDHDDLHAHDIPAATGPRFLEDELEHLSETLHAQQPPSLLSEPPPSRTRTTSTSAGAAAASAGAAAGMAAGAAMGARTTTTNTSAGPRGWSAPAHEEPEASSSNPLRVLLLVLTIGLAVGVAGGFLLGRTSGRQALALLRGERVASEPEQAAAPASGSPDQAATPSPDAGARPTTPAPGGSATSSAPSSTERPEHVASTPRESPTAPAAHAPRAAAAEAAHANTGRLVVRSSPARAEVLVNGIKKGETPLTLRDLPLGTHTIRVSRAGYQASTRKVTLSASRTADSLSFDLQPMDARAGAPRETAAGSAPAAGAATGTAADLEADRASAEATAAGLGALYVLSHPAGASVIVDGQVVGTTPLLVTNVPPGSKTVRLELAGHKPWSSTVHVAAGQRVRVAASLEETGTF